MSRPAQHQRPVVPRPSFRTTTHRPRPVTRRGVGASRTGAGKYSVLAIGTSTGGPNALADLLPRLPPNFPVPIVIVQHMPPIFTRILAERLTAASHLKVVEGSMGAVLQPGTAYIAPGDYHMTIARGSQTTVVTKTNQNPPEHSCRPAVDVLFRSVAEVYKDKVLAVVLTGMARMVHWVAPDQTVRGGLYKTKRVLLYGECLVWWPNKDSRRYLEGLEEITRRICGT